MTNNPKQPFNDATNAKKATSQKPHEIKDTIRDKDNAEPRPKPPTIARYPAPNKAPVGVMGSHLKEPQQPSQPRLKPPPIEIDITKGDPEKDLYIYGKITSMDGYSFAAKVYDLPSSNGLENGKVSKLQIQKHGQIIAHYDRGWDIKPETDEHRQAVDKIRNVFDPPDREFKPINPKGPDKDHGHDR